MKTLDELPEILDKMISRQKEKKARTYVARYKGKNLIMNSGKSSWKELHHAKSAVLCHFNSAETRYKYEEAEKYRSADGTERQNYNYNKDNIAKREKEFRAKLFELIEIVELVD